MTKLFADIPPIPIDIVQSVHYAGGMVVQEARKGTFGSGCLLERTGYTLPYTRKLDFYNLPLDIIPHRGKMEVHEPKVFIRSRK